MMNMFGNSVAFAPSGRRLAIAGLIAAAIAIFAPWSPARAAGGNGGHQIESQHWSFAGIFGHFDQAQLQRGYKVYKEVCAACHGMRLLAFRNLGEAGGPGFSEAAVKALAAEATISDGPNDDGEMFDRPGLPSDRLPSPFPNEKAARAANGGAYPPDLSVIAKARGVHHAGESLPGEIARWAKEIVTGYQEGGPDYLHALLTGYTEAPASFKLADGMNYNVAFEGNQIAMAQPLNEGQVEYTDGTPTTVDQYSRDVSAFLMWAAEPTLEERKKLGLRVIIYLIITALLLFLAKRTLWARVGH